MSTWTPILQAVVGSTAYGLATPDSDIDRIAIAAAPTADFHGLHPPIGKAASRVTTAPDMATHEVGKFAALALGCNPTLLETLWLDEHLYEIRTVVADQLIAERGRFLHQHGVRNAFLGYATQQLRRLQNRGDGTFSSNLRTRSHKHARHLWRLVRQGLELWQTGTMTVRLDDEQRHECFTWAENAVANPESAQDLITLAEIAMDRTRPAIPERPDEPWVEQWLRDVRLIRLAAVPVAPGGPW
ncbi:hypothetical protein [Alloactinosynnema sp. L-07]|uniref:nucleotidyltransferase domain-containing protein n=1 Tax=Alloactinosynnema sp. L-07 TaxID=1653480 RepID=UPI00065F0989|nr:nucleotidyltransferase domain-containing protein [Alloactinosynnema sp. L-07]CRK59055.1 hypothetical protein [Alloactinosynnema sp. L-07]